MAEYTKELLHPVVSESIIIDGAAVAAGAIVYQEQVPLLPPDRGGIAPFVRSSSIHGRSMEDSRGYFLKPSPIVDTSSPERDVYSALSIKGADSRKPEAGYSRMEPNKVRVYGMLDASVAERIFAVSAHLREEGVLTEWPIYFARPKTFPSVEGSTNLTGFRNRIGEDYSSRIPALREKAKQEGGRIIPVGEAGFVMQAISELKLGVLYRAMITNVRVSELGEVPQEYIPVHLKAAIEGLQARKPSWFSIWSTLEGLDPGSPEDQELYVSKVLPEILGENIARMHNANCQHGYLHAGNITLAGEIVDLDSVYAKTLFEDEKEAFTFKDTLHDIEVAMRSLAELTDFEVCQPTDGIDGFESVLRRFFLSYFAERYPDLSRDGSDETESIILEYLSWAYGDGSLEGYEEPRIVDPGKILDRVDSAIIEGNDPQAIMIAVLKEIEEKVIEWLEPIDRQSSFIRNIANPASIALLEFAKIIKISDLNILKLTQPHLIEAVFY